MGAGVGRSVADAERMGCGALIWSTVMPVAVDGRRLKSEVTLEILALRLDVAEDTDARADTGGLARAREGDDGVLSDSERLSGEIGGDDAADDAPARELTRNGRVCDAPRREEMSLSVRERIIGRGVRSVPCGGMTSHVGDDGGDAAGRVTGAAGASHAGGGNELDRCGEADRGGSIVSNVRVGGCGDGSGVSTRYASIVSPSRSAMPGLLGCASDDGGGERSDAGSSSWRE